MQPVAEWLAGLFGGRAEQVRLAYRRMVAGDTGRLVLADLSEICGENRTSFVPGDPQQTAFNEGRRSVLLHIRSVLGLRAGELLPYLPDQERPTDD